MTKWINLLTVILAVTIYFNDGSSVVIDNNDNFKYYRSTISNNGHWFASYTEGNAVHNIPLISIKEIVETPNMAYYGGQQ